MAQLLTSVKRALEVLDFFTLERHELSLAEISGRMDLHKSSVYRILRTLEAAHLLQRDYASGRYSLGLKILELGNRVLARYELRSIAAPHMEQLAATTGEIIHLSILDGGEIVYLEKKGAGQVLTVATKVGGRYPAYASAMGKLLLAFLPAAELDALIDGAELAALTPYTITDPGRLRRELERIRARGYALDKEEAFPGIRCIAAPVRGRGGKVIAAISATVPSQRLPNERIPSLVSLVTETAYRISESVADSGAEA